MNSEERPATGWDRLIADQQHTVPERPVKAHFASFSAGAASSGIWQNAPLAC